MNQKRFLILLCIIACLGFGLRVIDYDRIPPFAETQDEFFYPWSGMTFLQTGKPVAWSWFPAYKARTIVNYWGAQYPLVSPWVEKPPLYSLITGIWVLLHNERALNQVRLSVVRVIPVFLSLGTIFLTGLLAKRVFSPIVGLVAALIYSTIPSMVMASRLSLTENLLTPIMILTLYIFLGEEKSKIWFPVLIGLGCALAILTKDIGMALPVVLGIFYILQRNWKGLLIIGICSSIAIIIHPLMGFYYDWSLFKNVMLDYRIAHSLSGLPQLVTTLFQFPVVGSKEHLFPDGGMLMGYLLFFTSPFWLLKNEQTRSFSMVKFNWLPKSFKLPMLDNNWKTEILIGVPLVYFVLLSMLASGEGWSYFGWHVYPLFPFLTILMAKIFIDLWQKPNLTWLLTLTLILGASTIRFIFISLPREIQHRWQYVYVGLFASIFLGFVTQNQRFLRLFLLGLFICFIGVNIYTVFNLSHLYTSFAQPVH